MSSQLLAARAAFAALTLALLTGAAAVAGVRLGLFAYPTGLLVMAPATALGLAALAGALWWARCAFVRNSGDGKRLGLIALAASIAFLYVPLGNLARQWTSPAINDVSSDPDDPPHFVALARARTAAMNSPRPDPGRQVRFKGETNTAAYMLHTYYGTTSPHPVTKPHGYLLKTKQQMFWHAFGTAKKLGWNIVDYSAAEGRIEAVASSFWFGQKTDLVIDVRTAGTIGARIDVRAQSETGSHDFGGNLVRLEDFFAAFRGGGF